MVKINYRTTLTALGIITIAYIAIAEPATTSKIKLVKGNQYPICQELYKIIQRRENQAILKGAISVPTDYLGLTITSPEYHYQPHDNFKPVEWQPVSSEEVEQNGYYSEPLKGRFETEKRDMPNADPATYVKWKDQIKTILPIFTKATLDFNFDGTKETMLRYRSPWSGYWNCYFPPDAPYDFKSYNGRLDECNIVRYKGRSYVIQHELAVILGETHTSTHPSQEGRDYNTPIIPICKIIVPNVK